MHEDDHNAPPVNPLPPVVVVLSLAVAAIELIFQAAERGILGGAAGIGWRLDAIGNFTVFDPLFQWMIETGNFAPEHLLRFVSYGFVHASFTHALFVVVFVLAIGKLVAEAFSAWAFLAIFLASEIVGALAYVLVLDTKIPLIGGYPGVYGLIGAMTFMLWVRARFEGTSQFRAFALIGALLFIQLLFKVLFGGGDDWVADIAGFVTGFALSVFLAPGGGLRLIRAISQIRRR